jgi:hypothetical protein
MVLNLMLYAYNREILVHKMILIEERMKIYWLSVLLQIPTVSIGGINFHINELTGYSI